MAEINLGNVGARYELLSVLDYNLKRRVVETIRRTSAPPVTIDALSGIDLEVPDGSRLGLVGANGAGKSTLLAIMVPVALEAGATLIKPPYVTYYNWYQSVLLDPEGNVFRINFMM